MTPTAPPPFSRLRCIACGRDYPLDEIRYECDACSNLLEVAHDLERLKTARDGPGWRRLFDERLGARSGIRVTALVARRPL